MISLAEVISFTYVFCCTIFKLLAHYCARWCGHIVSGVLLRIGWCDDGHQVVSVGRVYLEIHTRMLTWWNEMHELVLWPTHQTEDKETVRPYSKSTFFISVCGRCKRRQKQIPLPTKGALTLRLFLLPKHTWFIGVTREKNARLGHACTHTNHKRPSFRGNIYLATSWFATVSVP